MFKGCKYLLPCGICDKYNIRCDIIKECKHEWEFVSEYYDSESQFFFNKYVCTKCGDTEYRKNYMK